MRETSLLNGLSFSIVQTHTEGEVIKNPLKVFFGGLKGVRDFGGIIEFSCPVWRLAKGSR